jgi:PAS domain S-box-containing protein
MRGDRRGISFLPGWNDAMPLSRSFGELHRVYDRWRHISENVALKYAIAVAAVGVATVLRLSVSGQLVAGVPFITFYPAVILVALLCGLWPGLLATGLSALAAWYLFFPATDTLSASEIFSLFFFVIICLINVGLVMLLSKAIEAVMAQEANVRTLVESAPNGIVVVDTQGRIKLVNASAERLFGYQHGELIDKAVELLVPERENATHEVQRQAFQRRPTTRAMGAGLDLTGRRKDGSEFPVEVGLNPVARNGKRAVLATVIDITDRKRAEEGQKLIIRELQHRTKNLIAVIQSVVNRSLNEGSSVEEAKQILAGRLAALAHSYELLSDAAWSGASLADIAQRQLASFSDRVQIRGCDITVGPSAAQQFALIIHELATNATKYGALSEATGSVSIDGENNGGLFWFRWKETGGPPVSIPTRRGFGSVILVDAVRPLGESVNLNFAPEGLDYELAVSLETIRPGIRAGA